MSSIVEQLSAWTNSNAVKLRDKGVQVTPHIPGPGSNVPWKGSIDLIYDGILVTYTVWERSILQTDLLVVNYLEKKTIVMEERTPSDAEVVHGDLDDVVRKLFDTTFHRQAG